jgi:hypothetical protein
MATIATGDGSDSAHRDGAYSDLPNKLVRAANGIDYAYRDTGPQATGGFPLVLLQHFRGNLDNWDPALIDALASARRVITSRSSRLGVTWANGAQAGRRPQVKRVLPTLCGDHGSGSAGRLAGPAPGWPG